MTVHMADKKVPHNSAPDGALLFELLFLLPNTHYAKSRYQRQVLGCMLLCIEAGKRYELTLLSAVHMLTICEEQYTA